MEKEKFTYNKKSLIAEYSSLTNFEYRLLPEDMQMAHADSIYDSVIKLAKERKIAENIGHSYRDLINPRYEAYFEANGCTFNNCDLVYEFSDIECFDVDKKYDVSKYAKERLAYYYTVIAQAKTDVIDSYVKRFYQAKIDAIEKENEIDFTELDGYEVLNAILNKEVLDPDVDLTEEERKHIMAAQLTLIVEEIEKGNTPASVANLPEEYKVVLDEIIESKNHAKLDEKQLKRNIKKD